MSNVMLLVMAKFGMVVFGFAMSVMFAVFWGSDVTAWLMNVPAVVNRWWFGYDA